MSYWKWMKHYYYLHILPKFHVERTSIVFLLFLGRLHLLHPIWSGGQWWIVNSHPLLPPSPYSDTFMSHHEQISACWELKPWAEWQTRDLKLNITITVSNMTGHGFLAKVCHLVCFLGLSAPLAFPSFLHLSINSLLHRIRQVKTTWLTTKIS